MITKYRVAPTGKDVDALRAELNSHVLSPLNSRLAALERMMGLAPTATSGILVPDGSDNGSGNSPSKNPNDSAAVLAAQQMVDQQINPIDAPLGVQQIPQSPLNFGYVSFATPISVTGGVSKVLGTVAFVIKPSSSAFNQAGAKGGNLTRLGFLAYIHGFTSLPGTSPVNFEVSESLSGTLGGGQAYVAGSIASNAISFEVFWTTNIPSPYGKLCTFTFTVESATSFTFGNGGTQADGLVIQVF